jgi:molecular chaperone GrpE
MSEPDADDADGTEANGSEAAGADEPTIGDIAEAPAGDADEALQAILAGEVADHDDLPAVEPDADLVERVAEADPELVAAELLVLRERVDHLQQSVAQHKEEVEDLESRLARKQADFQNYKQREQERLEDEKQRATEDLVTRLLDVRDNLARALDQDEDADIRGGVESTLRQLDTEFDRENVERIDPEPGEETDPQRHEVLMRVDSDQPEGTVADVHRPGYEMAGKVLRAAQVTVSEGDGESTD